MKTELSKKSNSNKLSKLAVGTVQFGQDYGVSNQEGRPSEKNIRRILDLASSSGITVLDTAPAYGQAERVIGRMLSSPNNFKIITKTCALYGLSSAQSPSTAILQTFEQSLSRMNIDKTYGLIVQLPDDLLGTKGDEVWKTLEDIKSDGSSTLIGASCYRVVEVLEILNRYPIDLIQLPFNIFDQELLSSGLLTNLNKKGIKVHTRSTFLQGLLLMDFKSLPENFTRAEPPLKKFNKMAKLNQLSRLELALRFVSSVQGIDNIVIGVTKIRELEDIISTIKIPLSSSIKTSQLRTEDKAVKTPSLWPPDTKDKWRFDFSVKKINVKGCPNSLQFSGLAPPKKLVVVISPVA